RDATRCCRLVRLCRCILPLEFRYALKRPAPCWSLSTTRKHHWTTSPISSSAAKPVRLLSPPSRHYVTLNLERRLVFDQSSVDNQVLPGHRSRPRRREK